MENKDTVGSKKSSHLQPVQRNGRSRSVPVQLTFKGRSIAV